MIGRVKETGIVCGTNKTGRFLAIVICFLLLLLGFHNVSAAQIQRVYTIDDTGSSVNITGGEKFNISLWGRGMYYWDIASYNSDIIELDDSGLWSPSSLPGSIVLMNWTFKGNNTGNTTLLFVDEVLGGGNETIINSMTLNITVNSSEPVNYLVIILVVAVITIVPTIIIVKWMKSGDGKL